MNTFETNTFRRVYLATNKVTPDEELEYFQKLPSTLQEEILNYIDSIKHQQLSEDKAIVILSDSEYNELKRISSFCGFGYDLVDITNDVILEQTDQSNLLREFLEDNLTVDIILDKINFKGMKSLSSLDKEILQKS